MAYDIHDLRLSVDILKTDGVRCAFFTPPDVTGIMKHWTDVARKPLDVLLIAGYPLTKKLCDMFFEAADLLVFRYGSSEAVSVSYRVLTQLSDYEDFNCGVLCKGTQVKVVDDDMKELAPGTPGRLLFKLPGQFSGYMAQPHANTSVITADGWFVCGDAGYLDEKGQLMVLQRYDHVIQHKGSTVYPAYIEKYIRDDPRVHSVVIVPVTSEKTEQIICACVVLVPGSSMTEEDVKRLVSERGKDGAVTPDRVLFFDSIDVNQRGKLKVSSLVEEVKKRLTKQ
ncbi:uncharacterized protein LOC131938552 [Physella acuta]|uniref:uncharacterized protein LOC131938552 n=1 Tax=Physella acuta TaxID=109671 RepID=UPI0027DAD1E1|nr:uncharacterized protein LOC131938552 [Physella acuta]